MSNTKIEVVPDPSFAVGGHAIIRLSGISILPPGATVRIDPIDDSLGDETGWPHGEIKPRATRQTPDGLELSVGPEVVDAPLLEPGVPVTITISDADVSAELVWPELPVSSGQAGAPPVVMSASQMAAEFSAAERAKAEAKRLSAEAEAKRERERLAADDAAKRDAAVAAAIAAAVKDTDDLRASPHETAKLSDAVRDLDLVLANGAASNGSAAHDKPLSPLNGASGSPKPVEALSTLQPVKPSMGATAAIKPNAQVPADPLSRLVAKPGDADRGAIPAIQSAADAQLPAIEAASDTTLPSIVVKQATAVAARNETEATVRAEAIRPAPASGLLAFFGGAALAAASLLLAVFAAPLLGIGPPPPQAVPRPVIADAFVAGPQSPRGEIATNIDLPTALRLADYNLHGVDRPIDRAEAEFWLKKAMSLTASHTQLRWALTQLGTLAAQPVSGEPDYEKARLLWEISAANGDPIALCFLGALAENGLGAPPNKVKALEFYKRSKEIGGCPATDDAIARLGR